MANIINKTKTFNSMILVVLSSIIVAISGVVVGFFVPKALGVVGYGYYKTFSLYSSYITFTLFGITNGIYIYYAGKRKDKLPIERIRFVSKFTIISQIIVSIVLGLISIMFYGKNINFFIIAISLAIYLFIFNLLNYFTIITQSILEFKKVIIKNFVTGLLTLVSALSVYLIYKITGKYVSYVLYILLILISFLLISFWLFLSYKDFVIGKSVKFSEGFAEIKILVKCGIVIMIADFIGSILFHIDLQFVSTFFAIDVFSVYSFAYSIITIIVNVIASVSTVLYPSLKSLTIEETRSNLKPILNIISVLFSIFIIGFFIVVLIINKFLPEYSNSINYIAILFPTILPLTYIKVCLFNYLQIYKKIYHCLLINVGTLIISISANFIAFYVFKTPTSISIASVISLTIYCVLYMLCTRKIVGIPLNKYFFYLLLTMSSFYLLYGILGYSFKGVVCILLTQLVISLIFFDEYILNLFKKRYSR